MPKYRWHGLICVVLMIAVLVTGCTALKNAEGAPAKVRDLEYTVVREVDIPKALQEQIDQRKAEDFRLTYVDGEEMYMIRGYGEQETGGYSVRVAELYEGPTAIYFRTELIGPALGERVAQTKTYPTIVIKTEYVDLPVVFE